MRSGRAWEAEEHEALVAGYEQGASIAELAQAAGRSELAVTSRLVKYGRLPATSIQGLIPNAVPRPADGEAGP